MDLKWLAGHAIKLMRMRERDLLASVLGQASYWKMKEAASREVKYREGGSEWIENKCMGERSGLVVYLNRDRSWRLERKRSRRIILYTYWTYINYMCV